VQQAQTLSVMCQSASLQASVGLARRSARGCLILLKLHRFGILL